MKLTQKFVMRISYRIVIVYIKVLVMRMSDCQYANSYALHRCSGLTLGCVVRTDYRVQNSALRKDVLIENGKQEQALFKRSVAGFGRVLII